MTLHWSWGLSTALILTLVIWLNGHQVRTGWLLGASVQAINMAFGLAYGQWTFAFLALPGAMFVIVYFRHPRYVKPKPLVLPVQDERILWARTCRSTSPDGHSCERPDVSHSCHPADLHYAVPGIRGDDPKVFTWKEDAWGAVDHWGLRQGSVTAE